MSSRIVGNLVVKAGVSRTGSAIWQKCGILMETDGRQYILMNRTFNPAGVPVDDQHKDAIVVSIFEPNNTYPSASKPTNNSNRQYKLGEFDDDIPF